MSVEQTENYLHSFESEALPTITWQEILDKGIVFAPDNVLTTLKEAEELLITHPGPNLERRKVLAPEWFGYWKNLLTASPYESDKGLVTSKDKLVKFEKLSGLLETKYRDENTGMIFVAGAEGHKGHVHAAKYMAGVVPVTIGGFEQDEYMQRKARKAPFLSLQLRLSMWFYEPTITHLTVLPRNVQDIPDNDHYNELFLNSGAKYFFVHEKDPYLTEKLARGKQDLERTIHHPYPELNITEEVQEIMPEVSLEELYSLSIEQNLRIIADLPVDSITERVKKLRYEDGGINKGERLGSKGWSMSEYLKGSFSKDINRIGYNETLFIE